MIQTAACYGWMYLILHHFWCYFDFDCDYMTQKSIIQEINANPNAGWQAAMNSRFENYTVRPWNLISIIQIYFNSTEGISEYCGMILIAKFSLLLL